MKEVLSKNHIEFAYVDICADIGSLLRFLKIRDTSPSHTAARERHSAGIPALAIDDEVFVVGGPERAQEILKQFELM